MSRATLYLIRHGEKPEPEENGLSAQGLERAQALPGVFGPGSPYNIGYIMAQHPGAGEPLLFLFFPLAFSSPVSIAHAFPFEKYQAHKTTSDHLYTDGAEARPVDTVTPLAQALGLVIDTSVKRDNSEGVADVVNSYSGAGNILICWEHKHLHDIMKALGVKHAPHYPDDR
jgi:hypothetical protein